MPQYTQADAQATIYTFKDGLLAKVAHDLKLRVGRFVVDQDAATGGFHATFEAASIEVVCARSHGVDEPSSLSASNKQEIAKNVRTAVLHVDKHPSIIVTVPAIVDGATSGMASVTLCGVRREVRLEFVHDAGRRVARGTLHQPDFGIKPYSAMFGTIKLRPDVRVELSLPAQN